MRGKLKVAGSKWAKLQGFSCGNPAGPASGG